MLLNWTVAKSLPVSSFPTSAVLLGSIAPDVSLYFLSIGGAAWFSWIEKMKPREVGRHMFGDLFYNDPIWISLHNVLHSPTVLLAALIIIFAICGREQVVNSWWAWFFGSCLLHTMVDIPVHHDDGPLIFWPLNWSCRFASPISYWDPDHYASIAIPFEIVLALTLSAVLLWQWLTPQQHNQVN